MVKDNGNNPMMIAAIAGVVAFVVGLLIGWMLLGWVIAPVEWTDAAPEHLSGTHKVEYVQLVADSYVLTGDAAKAQQRINQLGPGAKEALDQALANSSGVDSLRVSQLMTAVTAPAANA